MSNGILQSTLRELRKTLTNPLAPVIMVVVAVTLGLSGPFGTFQSLSPGGRLAYWGAIVFATFPSGYFTGTLVGQVLAAAPAVARIPAIGVGAGTTVFVVVLAVNWISFPDDNPFARDSGALFFYCVAIAMGVAVVFSTYGATRESAAISPAEAPATGPARAPAILARLPVQIRGPLVRMSMQDHYVEVETDKGTALVLMRMADAIAETAGTAGLQIHRSHWIALDRVAAVKRGGDKVLVTMQSGSTLPISRSFLAAARTAGLLR